MDDSSFWSSIAGGATDFANNASQFVTAMAPVTDTIVKTVNAAKIQVGNAAGAIQAGNANMHTAGQNAYLKTIMASPMALVGAGVVLYLLLRK